MSTVTEEHNLGFRAQLDCRPLQGVCTFTLPINIRALMIRTGY